MISLPTRVLPLLALLTASFLTETTCADLARTEPGLVIEFSGTESGFFTSTPDKISESVSVGNGLNTFGLYSTSGSNDAIFTGDLEILIFNGEFTQSYVNGTLFGNFSGSSVLEPDFSGGVTDIEAVIVGGTGVFEGLSGTIDIHSAATFLGVTGDGGLLYEYDSYYTGILVPEPMTASAGLIGLLMYRVVRSRRRANRCR